MQSNSQHVTGATGPSPPTAQALRPSPLDGLPLPPSCWMWKPRSKVYDSHNQAKTSKGLFSFRSIGAKEWHRRYVFVEGGEICYGKAERHKDKIIFFSTVRGGGVEPEAEMLKEKAPREAARLGWFLQSDTKRVVFACDTEETWRAWVTFVKELVARLEVLRNAGRPRPQGSPLSPPLPHSTAKLTAPPTHTGDKGPEAESRRSSALVRQSSASTGHKDDHDDDEPTTNFVDTSLHWGSSPPDQTEASELTPAKTATAVPTVARHTVPPRPQGSKTGTTSVAGTSVRGTSNYGDEEDSEEEEVGGRPLPIAEVPFSRGGDMSDNSDNTSSGSSDDDELSSSVTSDDDDDDDDESLSDGASNEAHEDEYEAVNGERCTKLRRIAATQHSHLASRLPALAPHLAPGDNTTNVVFSAAVDKVARGDSLQPRDLVVTRKHLYLFSKKKLGGGTKSRVVAVGDITGVMESTTSAPLLAILVPSFHDLLIKFPTGATATKEELIAHLFTLHDAASFGRRFRFEWHADVGGAIRRKEDERYEPLVSAAGDLTRAATRPALYPMLRMTGDTTVLWSSIVREVRAGRPPLLSAILVTDGAFYMLSDSLTKRGRRTALCDVVAVLYERDAQSVLLQCSRRAVDENGLRQGDVLFSIQQASEFTGLLEAFRKAGRIGYGRRIKVTASRQLYSQAQLLKPKRKKSKLQSGGAAQAAGLGPLMADDTRKKHQGLADRLRSAWKAGVRQETKYLARLRTRKGGDDKGASSANDSSGDDGGDDDENDLLAAALAGTNASFVFSPEEGLSNYLLNGAQVSAALDGFGLADDQSDANGDEDGAGAFGARVGSPVSAAGMGIRFQSQYRFVEELVSDYDDALALLDAGRRDLGAAIARWDALQLSGTALMPDPSSLSGSPSQQQGKDFGKVVYSAPCQRLSTKAIASLIRLSSGDDGAHEAVFHRFGEMRVACLTTEGVLILFPTSSSPSAAQRGSRGTRSGERGEGAVELFIPWPEVDAIVRCHHGSGAVVGVMTRGSLIHDMVMNLLEDHYMTEFVNAAATCYERYGKQHAPRDRLPTADTSEEDKRLMDITGMTTVQRQAPPLLPLFAAPRPENVGRALRKLVYDPFPTVALRYTPLSAGSDRLRLAVVPDVAEPCRRFGDNTIYFSGVAWRFRSETLSKMSGVVEKDPGSAMNRRNNHLYKSFLLVITNTAIYYCTKGGYESVRRTELSKLKAVYVNESDPDTVLLMIPSEYDMYFRVAGRGKEFVARLQEAYVEWTDYGLYYPGEALGSHRLATYFVPVKYTAPIGPLGTLTKPDEFNSIQTNRSAAECREQTERWHLAYLRSALDAFVGAVSFASGESGSVCTTANGTGASQALPKWEAAKTRLANCQSRLYFGHRRAFRFGLRAELSSEMAVAQQLLARYKDMQAAAEALGEAVAATDPIGYGAAASDASVFPELAPLVAEQSRRYRRFLDMRSCLQDVLEAVDSVGTGEASEEQQEELDALFAKARAAGFDDAVLWDLRQYQAAKAQQAAMSAWLTNADHSGPLADNAATKSLLAAAACALGVQPPPTLLPNPSLAESEAAAGSSSSSAGGGPTSEAEDDTSTGEGDQAEEAYTEMAAALRRTAQEASTLGRTTLENGCARAERLLQDAGSTQGAAAEARRSLGEQLKEAQRAIGVRRRHEADCQAVKELTQAVATHRAANDWDAKSVADLLSACQQLLTALPADEPVLSGERAVLCLHRETLEGHAHRLAQAAAFAQQEESAQRQYEADLRVSSEAAHKAEVAKQRRERARKTRRQTNLLSAWSAQTAKICAGVQVALDEGDDEPVRYAVKQCVLFQRTIAEGIKAQLATTQDGDTESTEAHQRLQDEGERLRAQLNAAAERAHSFLTRKERSKGSDFPHKDKEDKETDEDAENREAAQFPEALAEIIAGRNGAALIQYIEAHEDELSTHTIAEVKSRWKAVVQRAAWERQMHHAVECARKLGSRELLQRAVQLATAGGMDSDSVITDARASLLEDGPLWNPHRNHTSATETDSIDHSLVLGSSDERTPASGTLDADVDATRLELHSTTSEDDEEPEARRPSPLAAVGAEDIVLESTESSLVLEEPSPESAPADETISVSPTRPVEREPEIPSKEPAAALPVPPTPVAPEKIEELFRMLPEPAPAREHAGSPSREPDSTRLVQLLTDSVKVVLTHTPPLVLQPPQPTDVGGHAGALATAVLPYVADGIEARSVLVAWVNVFCDHLKPMGFFTKTPRTVRDVLGFIGDYNVGGDFLAPYTNRVVSDVDREMGVVPPAGRRRSVSQAQAPGAGEASPRTPEEQAQYAKVLAFTFVAAMLRERVLEAVVREMATVGAKARAEVLLPDATLSQPTCLQSLLGVARVCDAVVWPPWSFSPAGQRAAAAPVAPAPTPSAPSSLPQPPHRPPTPKASPRNRTSTAKGREAGSLVPSLPDPAGKLTEVSAGRQKKDAAAAAADARAQSMDHCIALLHSAVTSVSAYFTSELAQEQVPRVTDAAAPPLMRLFDESLHPHVAPVVADAVLPALVALLEAGLVRRYHLIRTRSVWDVLLAFQEHLQRSTRQLAGAEVASVVELVKVLTDTEPGSRYASQLVKVPEEQLQALRLRVFLRECLSRRLLFGFFDAFFPAAGVDVEWNAMGNGQVGFTEEGKRSDEGLWRFYDPRLCVLLPRHGEDTATAQLWAIVRRLSAIPFTLVIDHELR